MFARRFQDLNIWKESFDLTLTIYRKTQIFPSAETCGLVAQIRRSSSSVPANIAEGFDRQSDTEFARFLYIARGSLAETVHHLMLSEALKYISPNEHIELLNRYNGLSAAINIFLSRLAVYTKQSRHRST